MSEKLPVKEIDQDKLDELAKHWSRMVSCISHDLTTHLANIRMTQSGLSKLFPSLIKGYQLAVQHRLIEKPEFSENHIKSAQELFMPSLEESVDEMFKLLGVLRPYNQKLLSDAPETSVLSIKAVVDNLLKTYPYTNDQESKWIQTDCAYDFQFSGTPFFTDFLLSHLLANALKMKHKKNEGEIKIWTEESEDYNLLHFQENAIEIKEKNIEHVFDDFFSKRGDTITPGLGFCKLALLQRGGDVVCQTSDGHIDFVVKFPKIKV